MPTLSRCRDGKSDDGALGDLSLATAAAALALAPSGLSRAHAAQYAAASRRGDGGVPRAPRAANPRASSRQLSTTDDGVDGVVVRVVAAVVAANPRARTLPNDAETSHVATRVAFPRRDARATRVATPRPRKRHIDCRAGSVSGKYEGRGVGSRGRSRTRVLYIFPKVAEIGTKTPVSNSVSTLSHPLPNRQVYGIIRANARGFGLVA